MEPLNLVVYNRDPGTAQTLAASLSQHFDSVSLAGEYKEIRSTVARNRADILILDLETSQSGELGRLHREFPALCIVGTHRLADEKLWAEALDQGAADVCMPLHDDVLRSVLRERTQRAAAA